jgi:prepilin-type N-terminal cleavage/methylation domain-containing protein
MRTIDRKLKGRMPRQDGGFTLIELLVVIGIIVALAAITVPLLTKFAGKGDEGALAAETETIQSAMNAMMADKGIVAVTANDKGTTSNGQNTWTALPAGTGAATLDDYLKKSKTKFFYCWDDKDNVYAQNKTDGVAAVPEDAKAAAACATPP